MLIGFCARGWFWRGFLSDVTVVVLLFSLLQVCFLKTPWKVGICVLIFSFSIEIAQYYHVVDVLGIENRTLRILVGNYFDWLDLFAYFVGFCISVSIPFIANTVAPCRQS
ncbi:DUF2809 domain-containing protein [Buttiauxella izardii]|nr:DUF2809 domain-containing protein [Buttiauxella izardii]